MTDLTRAALVEAMAQAAARTVGRHPHGSHWRSYIPLCRAVLTALEALFKQHGLKVMPQKPTERSVHAGAVVLSPGSGGDKLPPLSGPWASDVASAMHRAAPWVPWEGGDA